MAAFIQEFVGISNGISRRAGCVSEVSGARKRDRHVATYACCMQFVSNRVLTRGCERGVGDVDRSARDPAQVRKSAETGDGLAFSASKSERARVDNARIADCLKGLGKVFRACRVVAEVVEAGFGPSVGLLELFPNKWNHQNNRSADGAGVGDVLFVVPRTLPCRYPDWSS